MLTLMWLCGGLCNLSAYALDKSADFIRIRHIFWSVSLGIFFPLLLVGLFFLNLAEWMDTPIQDVEFTRRRLRLRKQVISTRKNTYE